MSSKHYDTVSHHGIAGNLHKDKGLPAVLRAEYISDAQYPTYSFPADMTELLGLILHKEFYCNGNKTGHFKVKYEL
jgi:hypothetical protein